MHLLKNEKKPIPRRFPPVGDITEHDSPLESFRFPFIPPNSPHLLPLDSFDPLRFLVESTQHPGLVTEYLVNDLGLHADFLKYARELCQLEGRASFRGALREVGEDRTRSFIAAKMLNSIAVSDVQRESVFVAMQRGRFMELAALELDLPEDTGVRLFLVGMLATLSGICDAPMDVFLIRTGVEDLLHDLGISAESEEVRLFELILGIEYKDWELLEGLLHGQAMDLDRASTIYGKSAIWSRRILEHPGA